ncbi:MAG: ATP-binding protein [Myxococcaceae bacterium]
MDFLNRTPEMERLVGLRARPQGGFGVVWGRRRVGKTRLLLEWCQKSQGLYFVADQSSADFQRRFFAQAVHERFPGFADVEYPDWGSLLRRLALEAKRSKWRGPLVVDELPYLVESAPELPSILQRWVDHELPDARLTVVVAGSSQRLMQGLVLDATAPLFGRAQELMSLQPLSPHWMTGAFQSLTPRAVIEHYAAWGGIPRYWELASDLKTKRLEEQIDRLVLDPQGPLHREPDRLLLEERPSATALRPVLDAIGMGCHRLSEIAGRVGQPATSLSRPLQRLVDLGIVEREIPFGDSEKGNKRSLYKIADPFFRLWFRVVSPHRSMLAQASSSGRLALWTKHRDALLAQTWEQLCRRSTPHLRGIRTRQSRREHSIDWKPAQRYWQGSGPEWDLVAESVDGEHLLIAEVKWRVGQTGGQVATQAVNDLLAKAAPPFVSRRQQLHRAVFVPERVKPSNLGDAHVYDSGDVLRALAE